MGYAGALSLSIQNVGSSDYASFDTTQIVVTSDDPNVQIVMLPEPGSAGLGLLRRRRRCRLRSR